MEGSRETVHASEGVQPVPQCIAWLPHWLFNWLGGTTSFGPFPVHNVTHLAAHRLLQIVAFFQPYLKLVRNVII